MSATSDLVDAVVTAINAAVSDGTITRPISVQKKYVVTRPLEESEGVTVIVKAGRPVREPGTLDGMSMEDLSVRLLVEAKLSDPGSDAVESMLDLVEQLQDEIQTRVLPHTFVFVSGDPEDDGPYDEDKLRNEHLFYSVTILSFENLRQVA